MRTVLFSFFVFGAATIGAFAIGAIAYIVSDEVSKRRARRQHERRPKRRIEGSFCERYDAYVQRRRDRPPRSQYYREWFETTDELAGNLTKVGGILLEQRRRAQ